MIGPLLYLTAGRRRTVVGPELTSATDTALGPTSANIGVDTDTGDGTLYWVILLTADSTPTKAEVKAGQKSGGGAAEDDGSQAVSGTGTQTISTKPTMLNPETGYKVAFMHENATGGQSDVLVGDGFTTEAIVIGTANGGGTSTADPSVITASLAVAVGDLVIVVTAEQSAAVTVTAVTDNLGNTYTAQNVGSVNSSCACRTYYSIVTSAGTITAINVDTTASSNDFASQAAAFNGPFGAIDANVANKNEFARTWTGTASGTLAQASELVIGWIGMPTAADPITAVSPWTAAAANAAGGVRRVAINYLNTEATTSVTPEFTGAADAQGVVGTLSFTRSV